MTEKKIVQRLHWSNSKAHEKKSVLCARFNSNGSHFISGGDDKNVRIWKYISVGANVLKKYASNNNDNNHPHQETAHVHTFKGHGYPVQTVDITKDNSTIISAGGDRDIFIFDVGKGHLKRRLKFHKAAISSINFNPHDNVIIAGSYDRTVSLWDVRMNNIRGPGQILEDATDAVLSVNGKHESQIYVASVDGILRTYDIRNCQRIEDHFQSIISHVGLSQDKECLIVSTLNNTINVTQRETGDVLATYTGHTNSKYKSESCFSKNDKNVVGTSEDGSVYVWDLVSSKLINSTKCHQNVISSIHRHPTLNTYITSSYDGSLSIWKHNNVKHKGKSSGSSKSDASGGDGNSGSS